MMTFCYDLLKSRLVCLLSCRPNRPHYGCSRPSVRPPVCRTVPQKLLTREQNSIKKSRLA